MRLCPGGQHAARVRFSARILTAALKIRSNTVCRPLLCSLLGNDRGHHIPPAGSAIAGVLAYNMCKQNCKNGDQFGTGVHEGIIGPESANNALRRADRLPPCSCWAYRGHRYQP
jgi:TctA family transporter